MDANGQRFWLARGGTPWNPDVPGTLALLPGHLQLASQTSVDVFVETPNEAEALLERTPMTRDAFGTRAFVDQDGVTVRATGAFSEPEPISASPVLTISDAPLTDLALGWDGFLYGIAGGAIMIQPLSHRFSAVTLSASGFAAWRFTPAPEGGGWALDRTGRKLARLAGKLLPDPLKFSAPPVTAFQPIEANPDAPSLTVIPDGWLQDDEDPVALACSAEGRLAVLLWTANAPRVRLVEASGQLGPTATLTQLERPYSLAWLANERFAVLAPGVAEAVVFAWREGNLVAGGEVYPLRGHDGGSFLQRTTGPLEYPSRQPTADLPERVAPRPLVALALPALARHAEGELATPFDSGQSGFAWHRLYVEAQLPSGTGFTLLATTTDSDRPEDAPQADDWQPHHFGAAPAAGRQEPRAAWMPGGSEIPGHSGFSATPPQRDRNGVFTILLQRVNRPVRTLQGRFLHLRIILRGNLRSTPCLLAVRAYGPRFSYQDKYLPALYRETLFGPEADAVTPGGPSTRPDFLGRFLANFEGVLTPLEDKVAHSWLLTDPTRTPDEALDWLGSWIGVTFAPWYPAQQRRRHLTVAPELFRRRGTFKGLQLALDVATGNGVSSGRIVVVEDHWFRRTLQTVLGVKLDRDFDPLLGGTYISGNSKVGNTLFLSEEGMEKKFLALFDASIRLKAANQETVDTFFSSLAHRVTVIVHETASSEEFALIERICAAETPAHIVTRVRRADADFVVGLTALLSVDTYLRPHPTPPPVTVDTTTLGDGALLRRPPSLDPRLEGGNS